MPIAANIFALDVIKLCALSGDEDSCGSDGTAE